MSDDWPHGTRPTWTIRPAVLAVALLVSLAIWAGIATAIVVDT